MAFELTPPPAPRRSVLPNVGLRDDRGFTVLEALIATAIVLLIAFTGLAACKAAARVLVWANGTGRSAADIDAQTLRFRNDAASALAVFVPAPITNGRLDPAQEVDFYSKTDDGRAILWRYRYDPTAHTLQRWDFDADGTRGVRDVATGIIDPAATYPPLKGVTHFTAGSITADQLGDPVHNTYGGLGAIFRSPPRALPVRFADPGLNELDAVGGNGIVEITLTNQTAARVIHLAAGSLPTGFTVRGVPVWHAIVYRVDQTHRSWFGLAGKSHVFINAHVDVSYDNWASRISWCDFNLLGNPDGLDGHDPHADYAPDLAIERSDSILATCRQRHPLPPERDSPGNAPDPDAVHPPLLIDPPPPAWCGLHPGSPACRAVSAGASP